VTDLSQLIGAAQNQLKLIQA